MRTVARLAPLLLLSACAADEAQREAAERPPLAERQLVSRQIEGGGNAVVCNYSDGTRIRVLGIASVCP